MNPITVQNVLGDVPEGVAIDDRRLRLTAVLGLAMATIVPLPTEGLAQMERRQFFNENAGYARDQLFEINEVMPFSVDRAMDYGFRVWSMRYNFAYDPSPVLLLCPNAAVAEVTAIIPEIDKLCVSPENVRLAAELIKSAVAV